MLLGFGDESSLIQKYCAITAEGAPCHLLRLNQECRAHTKF